MAPIATVAVVVHPEDLRALYEGFASESPSKASRDDVLLHEACLAMLHLAWIVTVRRWAGSEICIDGNYYEGACYVGERGTLIKLDPEDSLQELVHQLSSAMAATNAPCASHQVSSRSLGNYSTTICLPGIPRPSQKYQALEKLPQPNAYAIDSWDGNLTYAELDDLTSRLAHHLVVQGVRPSTFVLCCFSKSTWAIVGRLAILKAGGAYISIDASDPPFYLDSIIRRTQTRIMLTAPEYIARFQTLVSTVVEVTPSFLSCLPVKEGVACCDVRPDSPCLILFTSGSTGTPKGIIQEHRSYATAIADYVVMLGLDDSSRVLQFDDYAFDISNNDYLAPLTAGGCCCVPTPEKTIAALRENINALRVNMTFLTPTVAIQLGPHDMPTLRTVCIGGEPPSRDLLQQWSRYVRLINQYGMGEAATFCAYNDRLNPDRNGIVGRAGSGAIWIANPASPEQLVPVGAVGEILIEGPHLARGYLDGVAAKPDVGFLSRPPAWMQRIHPHRGPTRVYRSGDLGRYLADGTVEHLGRKDTMLKLNGCRVELVEVECVLRQCLSDEDAVVIDVLGTMGTDEEPVLTAFVYVAQGSERKPGGDIDIQTIDEDHAAYPLVLHMNTVLHAQLPKHMIPSLFLLVDRIPRTKSNKTDRRRLHMYGQDFYMARKF
ncbi:hypothetical protein C8R44DRAFT_920699 [Mycena epipterygia]|nr:hypothetical protein C8R44DRAFT_920699 [Mycena epipterygia]